MFKDVRKAEVQRPVIYQLMVRTFGNANETRVRNGSMEVNGCGKFADINEAALESLKKMGFTHLWLTGVLEQASGTEYPNRAADDPALLKGKAGSPYAIRDYFDVCPDYALDPDRRLLRDGCDDPHRARTESCRNLLAQLRHLVHPSALGDRQLEERYGRANLGSHHLCLNAEAPQGVLKVTSTLLEEVLVDPLGARRPLEQV